MYIYLLYKCYGVGMINLIKATTNLESIVNEYINIIENKEDIIYSTFIEIWDDKNGIVTWGEKNKTMINNNIHEIVIENNSIGYVFQQKYSDEKFKNIATKEGVTNKILGIISEYENRIM